VVLYLFLLFKYLNSWRIPFLIASIVSVFTSLLFFRLAHESARFYLTKNNLKLFIENLRKIAIVNGFQERYNYLVLQNYHDEFEHDIESKVRIASNHSIAQLEKSESLLGYEQDYLIMKKVLNQLKASIELHEKNANNVDKPSFNVFSLIKYKSQRTIFLIMCFTWFSVSGIYYGISINLKNLPGDIYLIGIIMYLVETLSYIISAFMINVPFIGRKGSMLILYAVSIITYLLLVFITFESSIVIIALSMIARICIASVFNIIYTYSTEVYPSVVRSFGLGLNNVCARVGGMTFPIIIEVFKDYVNHIFLGLNIIIFIITFWIDETCGKPLRETIPEVDLNNNEVSNEK